MNGLGGVYGDSYIHEYCCLRNFIYFWGELKHTDEMLTAILGIILAIYIWRHSDGYGYRFWHRYDKKD